MSFRGYTQTLCCSYSGLELPQAEKIRRICARLNVLDKGTSVFLGGIDADLDSFFKLVLQVRQT